VEAALSFARTSTASSSRSFEHIHLEDLGWNGMKVARPRPGITCNKRDNLHSRVGILIVISGLTSPKTRALRLVLYQIRALMREATIIPKIVIN